MDLMEYIMQFQSLFKETRIKDFHIRDEESSVYLVVDPEMLTKYKDVIDFKIRFYKVKSQNGKSMYEPLDFDPFFQKCKE